MIKYVVESSAESLPLYINPVYKCYDGETSLIILCTSKESTTLKINELMILLQMEKGQCIDIQSNPEASADSERGAIIWKSDFGNQEDGLKLAAMIAYGEGASVKPSTIAAQFKVNDALISGVKLKVEGIVVNKQCVSGSYVVTCFEI